MEKTKKIFIATGNQEKLADFQLYLGDKYDLKIIGRDCPEIEIVEGIDSIEDNAILKAKTYAVKTDMIAIGDDTGFFIDELNGEPGVALKRWGGELPEDAGYEKFWQLLQQKTKNLKSYRCCLKRCIAIVAPDGDYQLIYKINQGTLNKEKLKLPYNGTDYPLASVFESDNREKTWDEMSDQEKKDFHQDFIKELKQKIELL